MAETLLERHYRDRVQSVRQLATRQPDQPAPAGQQLEDLVALCADLAVSGRDLLEKEYRRLFKEPTITVALLRERRRALEGLTTGFLQVAESIRAAAVAAEPGSLPSGTAVVTRIEDAIKTLSTARTDVLQRWPVGDDQEIAEAQASAARGEGHDVEEAFARIGGASVEQWRRRRAKEHTTP